MALRSRHPRPKAHLLGKLGVILRFLLVKPHVLQQQDLQRNASCMRRSSPLGQTTFMPGKASLPAAGLSSRTAPLLHHPGAKHATPRDIAITATWQNSQSSRTWPSLRAVIMPSTSGPMESLAFSTLTPSNWVRRGTTGSSLNLSSGPDFGRPCVHVRGGWVGLGCLVGCWAVGGGGRAEGMRGRVPRWRRRRAGSPCPHDDATDNAGQRSRLEQSHTPSELGAPGAMPAEPWRLF